MILYRLMLALTLYSVCASASSAEEPVVLRGHDCAVRVVRFSPDGKLLATGSFDGRVIIFDPKSANEVKTFPQYTGVDLAFAPNGNAIALSGAELRARETIGKIRAWDFLTESFRFTVSIPGGGTSLAFVPDGKQKASILPRADMPTWPFGT